MNIHNLRDYPNHIPTLANWHYREWGQLNPARTIEKRIASMHECMNSDPVPSMFIAVDDDDNLAGSAALVAHDMDTHPELSPWLAAVYVAPEFRRRGIGSQLVRHVMSFARQHNLLPAYLFTPDQEALYARLGWLTLKVEPYHNHQVTVMCLED